jgi:lactam utilization protein B
MNTMMMNSRQDDEDRAESLADAIEARAVELLMHGEACDPMDGFNISEAFGEATTNEKMVMAKVLAERKFDQAGILLDMISRTYWAKMADEMAREELT